MDHERKTLKKIVGLIVLLVLVGCMRKVQRTPVLAMHQI